MYNIFKQTCNGILSIIQYNKIHHLAILFNCSLLNDRDVLPCTVRPQRKRKPERHKLIFDTDANKPTDMLADVLKPFESVPHTHALIEKAKIRAGLPKSKLCG